MAAVVILLRRGGKHADRALEAAWCSAIPRPGSCPGSGSSPAAPSTRPTARARRGRASPPPRASWRRRPGSSWPDRTSSSRTRAGSRPRRCRSASTRSSTWLSPLAHSPPKPDGSETVDAGWFTPREALDRHAADELPLVFPTIKHLESLLPYANAEEALEAARSRPVEPVLPPVDRRGRRAPRRAARAAGTTAAFPLPGAEH